MIERCAVALLLLFPLTAFAADRGLKESIGKPTPSDRAKAARNFGNATIDLQEAIQFWKARWNLDEEVQKHRHLLDERFERYGESYMVIEIAVDPVAKTFFVSKVGESGASAVTALSLTVGENGERMFKAGTLLGYITMRREPDGQVTWTSGDVTAEFVDNAKKTYESIKSHQETLRTLPRPQTESPVRKTYKLDPSQGSGEVPMQVPQMTDLDRFWNAPVPSSSPRPGIPLSPVPSSESEPRMELRSLP